MKTEKKAKKASQKKASHHPKHYVHFTAKLQAAIQKGLVKKEDEGKFTTLYTKNQKSARRAIRNLLSK